MDAVHRVIQSNSWIEGPMSHRKFEAPRHGSLAYLPLKRTKFHRGQLKSQTATISGGEVRLGGFMGVKSGMTHVVREETNKLKLQYKKEVVEAVTLLETPPMVVLGLVGYVEGPKGLKQVGKFWAKNIPRDAQKRIKKSLSNVDVPELKRFKYNQERYETDPDHFVQEAKRIGEQSDYIRAIMMTQPAKVSSLTQKRAHLIEIVVIGGESPMERADWVFQRFEHEIEVGDVFSKDEFIELSGITKGHGVQGTTKRWGTTILQHKSRKGIRKVGCIGPWHPSSVRYSVPRAGQMGYHHRMMINKQIYRIDHALRSGSGSTDVDLTEKPITAMGGIPHYGVIRESFIMIKGTCMGPKKRFITMRKCFQGEKYNPNESIIKFIDTSSKLGHGRFQTSEEKKLFMGPLKKDVANIE